MYSLVSLLLCGHGAFRCGVLLNIYDSSRFVGSQVSHVLFFFFRLWFETGTLLLLFVWWGWSFSFLCCTLLSCLAVFFRASAFNQGVSTWNTGAVTTMERSKCTLSASLSVATPSAVVFFNIRQLEFHRITILTRFIILFCVFETAPFLLFVVGWSFLFFVANSLAVFQSASVFNQDVSKWNTGAVTTMENSKCTLSLSLSVGHAFHCCVF